MNDNILDNVYTPFESGKFTFDFDYDAIMKMRERVESGELPYNTEKIFETNKIPVPKVSFKEHFEDRKIDFEITERDDEQDFVHFIPDWHRLADYNMHGSDFLTDIVITNYPPGRLPRKLKKASKAEYKRQTKYKRLYNNFKNRHTVIYKDCYIDTEMSDTVERDLNDNVVTLKIDYWDDEQRAD